MFPNFSPFLTDANNSACRHLLSLSLQAPKLTGGQTDSYYDSGRDHQHQGGGGDQAHVGLPQLPETAHQHAGLREGEWRDQRPLFG